MSSVVVIEKPKTVEEKPKTQTDMAPGGPGKRGPKAPATTSPKNRKVKSAVCSNSTAFCDVCKHSVYDMSKHLQSTDHKRILRRRVVSRRVVQVRERRNE